MAFDITLEKDWDACASFIDELTQSGFREEIFQSRFLLGIWFKTVGKTKGIENVLLQVRDTKTAAPIMLLPLIKFTKNGLQTIEFADFNVIDYNAPLINPQANLSKSDARKMIKAVRKALPAHDVLNLEKVRKLCPNGENSAPNPLSLLTRARPCAVNGNVLKIDGPWEGYTETLSRKFRKELRRSERVLQKVAPAQYHQITDVEKGLKVLEFINDTQRARISDVGLTYTLDDPELIAFYRQIVIDGIESGDAIMTTIESDDEIVAATMGIATNGTHGGLRICNTDGKWSSSGPGRLIMFNTIRMLHEGGFKTFDFTIGNYALKRRIGVEQLELINIVYAGSVRGLRHVFEHMARGLIRLLREKGILQKKTYKNMGA